MIVLDTSVLVDALTTRGAAMFAVREAIDRGERMTLTTIGLYEWLRGPRTSAELAAQEALFPATTALGFGHAEAAKAAELYRAVRAPRGREADLAIAACAICAGATLWTANLKDFRDIPGLDVAKPE